MIQDPPLLLLDLDIIHYIFPRENRCLTEDHALIRSVGTFDSHIGAFSKVLYLHIVVFLRTFPQRSWHAVAWEDQNLAF